MGMGFLGGPGGMGDGRRSAVGGERLGVAAGRGGWAVVKWAVVKCGVTNRLFLIRRFV